MNADESALIVPALQLAPLVEQFRRRHDPSARAGVPPHLTVMYPFLEPDALTAEALSELDRLLAATPAFDYALVAVREFDGGVLYLAPEPAHAFIRLTETIGSAFGLVPYRGAHDTVVPHLTVAQEATEAERAAITTALGPSLPLRGSASAGWLMVGNNESGWRRQHAMSFAAQGGL